MSVTPSLPRVWGVPYQRNLFFTGREDVLEHLHRAFTANPIIGLSQPQGVNGLGGIGKTQTVIEYAYRYYEEYQAVFWIRADSSSGLITDFVFIADQLQLPERVLADQRLIIEAVQRWLRINPGWLLIFDNVDELATIDSFLPKDGRGHILLTTRARTLGNIAQRIEIEQMEPEVGALFLLRRAGLLTLTSLLDAVSENNRSVALSIVGEMGGLPLALDQAGAYISATSCTLSEYLESYRTRSSLLLQERSSNSDYPESVATTWSLSFEKVLEAAPVAVELLHLFAFLHPDAIPEEIITEGSAHMGELLGPIAYDQLQLDQAISEILKYSLISRNPDKYTFTIHRLVQVIFKANLSEDMQYLWAIRSVQAVGDTFPSVEPSTWSHCQRCLLHAQRCAELIEEWGLSFPNAARLLNQTAVYLRVRAQYAEAEPLYLQALIIWQKALGAVHSHVAAAFNNLACLYKEWGKYEQVERFFGLAFAIWEQTEDHLSKATCLFNLADFYQSQGKYGAAEPLYQQALAIRQQKRGSQDPATATVLHNLATLYREQNKYRQAELFYRQAYNIREQKLGLMHPDTVISLNGLAQLYMERGRYSEAEHLLAQRALPILEPLLGLEHPDVATLLHNLAAVYNEQGKYEQVEFLYQKALTIWEQKLGPWHPRTADTLNNLATWYDERGRYKEAETFYQRAYAIYQRAFGGHHPRSATILNNLADLYRSQEKYDLAVPLYMQVLALYKEIFGPEHINITVVLNNLALLHRKQGDYVQAELLFEHVVSIRERILGKRIPERH